MNWTVFQEGNIPNLDFHFRFAELSHLFVRRTYKRNPKGW